MGKWLLLGCLFLAAPARAAEGVPVTFGGELRLRSEALDNARDLESGPPDSSGFYHDSYQFYRLRYRLWVDARPREALRLYLRLGNEYRWGSFAGAVDNSGNVTEAASVRDPESRVSLENGWAEIRLPARSGLSFRFGRMDLMYGEGFLIFDGTPMDGSSSSYFDAMLLNWTRGRVSADLFTAKLQDEGFGTRAQDEDLHGLYAHRNRLDLYLLHRNKHGRNTTTSGVLHPVQYTTALGARYAILPETGWQVAAEAAGETGRYRDGRTDSTGAPIPESDDRRGLGGYLRGGWTSPGALHPGFELGGVYLSGDDPKTGRYEGWDGFYSEWPKYSELYVYTLYDNTTRVGVTGTRRASPDDAGTWTNLQAGWLEARLRPRETVRLSVRAALLGAVERTGMGPGRNRGLLAAGQLDWTPLPGVQAQLLGERFDPGNFYSPGADVAWYGRAQMTTRF